MQLHVVEPIPWPPHDEPLESALARAAAAERAGYRGVWLAEPTRGDRGIGPATHLAAAWLAARTTRIGIGVDVTLAPSFHPLRLAEELALLDLASDGRFTWAAAPLPAPAGAAREAALRDLQEQIEVVEKAWTGQPFEHAGERFEIPRLRCLPAPGRPGGPAPWIAVSGDDDDPAVAWAGATGRGIRLDAFTDVSRVRPLQRAHRAAASHAAATGEPPLAVARLVHVDTRDARARATAASGGGDPERDVVGDPEACRERIAAVCEGADVAVLLCWHRFSGVPPDAARASERLFLERVAPHFA